MNCPKSNELCPYWKLPYWDLDKRQSIIYEFKEYLIDHFYLTRSTANDVYDRYLENKK